MLNLLFIFVIGTVVGSFLNVCIHRLPRGESIVFPASHCPHCGRRLSPLDLIPVLGYFLLKGKCRYCRAPISFRYPMVELATAVCFTAAAVHFPVTLRPLDFFFAIIFVILMIAIFFIDLEQQVIPDAFSVSGMFFGLAYNLLKRWFHPGAGFGPLVAAVCGLGLGYAIFWLISRLGKLYFKKEVMGEGDLVMAACLGAYLGWQGMLMSVFLAYLLAGVVLLALLALRLIKSGQYVPFGPALAAGGLITLFYYRQILAWYLGLLF